MRDYPDTLAGLMATPDGMGYRPHHRAPSRQAVGYWRDALGLLVIVVALPWLLWHLLTNPARVLAGRGPVPAGS